MENSCSVDAIRQALYAPASTQSCTDTGSHFLARLTDARKLYEMGETIAAAEARQKAEEAKAKK